MYFFVCLIGQFACSAILVNLFKQFALKRELLDVPNSRSSHSRPVPRLGGIAFGPVLLLGAAGWIYLLFSPPPRVWYLLAASGAVLVLGIADDLLDLPSGLRLLLQAAIAYAFLVFADLAPVGELLESLRFFLLMIWLVALTNAYNFMDGVDGIAGSQALVVGLLWLIVGKELGTPTGVIALCVVGTILGFLVHNWAPATIFMGDAGSTTLGFLFAGIPLITETLHKRSGGLFWPVLCQALVVWPFLVDTAVTIIWRASTGANIFRGHRSHLYQRLSATGSSHRGVALLYTFLSLFGALFAFLAWNHVRGSLVAAAAFILISYSGMWIFYFVRRAKAEQVSRSAN